MPIYAYRCASCGHAKDVLQKLSDPPLTVCPACGASSFAKQVTAAGFQLKGSGWYATDFKGNGAKKPDAGDGAKTDGSEDRCRSRADRGGQDRHAPSPATRARRQVGRLRHVVVRRLDLRGESPAPRPPAAARCACH